MAGMLPVYMRARCKTGLVAAMNGPLAHIPAEFRTAFNPDGSVHFRAEYACGGVAPRAVVLPSSDVADMCPLCEDAAKGPCVYRCFNAAAGLIYIGSAEVRLRRIRSHERRTPWWHEVAEVKAEHFPTIFEARVAERRAIAAEAPLYNKAHRKSA
jgi:hypothetical protein